MTQPLLATKFHRPPPRARGVVRARLLEQLTAGLHKPSRLTLISAPAGYGKTTLAAEWLRSLRGNSRLAWLSLDEDDNDPARFIGYWLGAFQQVDKGIGKDIWSLLDTPHLPPINGLLDELLNDLATIETPIVLVLDDYHVITNLQIHEALEYFINHQPEQVHLVITTREDPPLPLARLRARGQLTEIRARDLRFTPEEARRFLDLSLNLSLTEEALHTLDERTEGWAAGLQLAALALQHQADPATFIETFRGSHRYVLDYLAEEVIRQQGENVQAFLTQTSVLERFNAEACAALTGRADSQAVIEYLGQANLFIIPLDDERCWYRYHHLFSDFLRSLLSRPEQTRLYQMASAWHESNDLIEEAVRYALASGDSDFAADVIERTLKKNETWSGGNLMQLSSWLDALPQPAFHSRPWLSLNAVLILYLSGRFEQAETLLAQTEHHLKSQLETSEVQEMLALVALYRGSIAAVHGDFQRAIEQTSFAQGRLLPENHLARARAFFNLGLANEIADQTGQAADNYLQSSKEAKSAGVLFLTIHALCAAAQVQIKQGRLHQAAQTCQTAIELAEGARLIPLGLAWTILGGIALEQNDLASSEKYLQDGIALSRMGGLMDDVVLGVASLARLRVSQDDHPRALDAIREASSLLQAYGVQRMERLANAILARMQLTMGQKGAAVQWAAAYQSIRVTSTSEFEELILARVLLSTGDVEILPAILQPILDKANAAGRMQTSMEAMLLLGLFHQAQQDTPSALNWLEKSLRLAAPEGYTRIFLDEGEALLELLPKVRPAAPEFVDKLLSMSRSVCESHLTPLEQLPDPLSEQEIRVLILIVAGKSNREIAEDLVISVGTAKWHVHNVLQKLGVRDRPQAIARARELGI